MKVFARFRSRYQGLVIRGVEGQRPKPIGVPEGKCLSEKGAVRVAIEVDLGYSERVEDGCQVVGGEGRAVQVAGAAELAATQSAVDESVEVAHTFGSIVSW
ncbi:MAG TPA: hypothetical protein VIW94_04525 [Acidimicrobiia bacterium]